MILKDKDLKELYQSQIKENPPHKTGCPDVELLLRSFSGDITDNEKIEVIDHISSCGNCYRKFEAVRQILKESNKLSAQFSGASLSETEVRELKQKARERILEIENADESARKTGFLKKFASIFNAKPPLRYATAIAGIFVVAMAALFVIKTPRTIQQSTLRGEKQGRVQLISPKGEIEELPDQFQWSSKHGVKEYQIVLMDEELTRFWNSEKTAGTEIPIPPEIKKGLQRAKIYYWKVLFFYEDGTKRESELQIFQLTKNQIQTD